MLLSEFDYKYPPELVANYPLEQRDASRLMVLDRQSGTYEHKMFRDIIDYFESGDVLVLNNSKVFPCRLYSKKPTGGKVEIFLLSKIDVIASNNMDACPTLRDHFVGDPLSGLLRPAIGGTRKDETWSCLITDSKKIPEGTRLDFAENFFGIVRGIGGETTREIELHFDGDLNDLLEKHAHVPLPRYIKRADENSDKGRYQTVFAKETGSVAAPTAGFHFTPEILETLHKKGVQIAEVTLHVGIGTFLPVKTEKIEDHEMHEEFYSLSQESAETINKAKKENRRVTVVGTTATRVLESCASGSEVKSGSGWTRIFIHPPYQFKIVDRLITNFHQPQSTLLMLVSAMAGQKFIMECYREAISKKYRLFSYGDAMLIE